jgi:hypothetical protein
MTGNTLELGLWHLVCAHTPALLMRSCYCSAARSYCTNVEPETQPAGPMQNTTRQPELSAEQTGGAPQSPSGQAEARQSQRQHPQVPGILAHPKRTALSDCGTGCQLCLKPVTQERRWRRRHYNTSSSNTSSCLHQQQSHQGQATKVPTAENNTLQNPVVLLTALGSGKLPGAVQGLAIVDQLASWVAQHTA